jgi:hypothetical protein
MHISTVRICKSRAKWVPYQYGMARPQVADGGTASNMEDSCEYIE